MIVTDYGGRAPNVDALFGGAVQAWNIDTETHHDYTTGVDVERPFNSDELVRFAVQIAERKLAVLFSQLQTLIDSVAMISTTAANDSNDAFTRRGQIETWTAATTAHAAVIRGIASPTVAQIKEELAVAVERDVVIAGEVDNFYHWRALVDGLLMLLSQCVAGLARLATRTPDAAP